MEISWEILANLLLVTIFMSMALMPVASRLAHRVGAVDIPNGRSIHVMPMPRMGGLAVSLSLGIGCLAFLPANDFRLAFLAGLAVVVATGFIDDAINISPRWKLVGQALAASLFVWLSGVSIHSLGDIVGLGNIELGNAAFAFTVFCFVGGMNAFNLLDGLDGLAGGLTTIAGVFLLFFAWRLDNVPMFVLAACLVGSVVGFLSFNWHPARIFMGDNGSLTLGYVLSVLVLMLSHSGAGEVSLVTLATVIALPLLDTLLVMTRRVLIGKNPFHPDKTHLHHRLIGLGLSHSSAVGVMYALSIAFGGLAFSVQSLPVWGQFASLIGFGGLIFGGVLYMQHRRIHYGRPQSAADIALADTLLPVGWLANWIGLYGKYIGIGILLALLLPALMGSPVATDIKVVLALFVVVIVLMGGFWGARKANRNVLNGMTYLSLFVLLLLYKVFMVSPSWVNGYVEVLASIAAVWVILKLHFASHRAVLIVSEFELLVMFVCGFIAFIVMEDTSLSPKTVNMTQQAVVLSIPFLLLTKTLGRIYDRKNYWIEVLLIGGMVMVGIRWLLGM
jgi:UDP-GlcNAc:undecaprenyl-phosphate GlcNAc-1-phosphate transferase